MKKKESVKDKKDNNSLPVMRPVNKHDGCDISKAQTIPKYGIYRTESESFEESLGKEKGIKQEIKKHLIQIYNEYETEVFCEIVRSCVGAEYKHTRMPTADEMDCSGIFIYALDKMGYEVPSNLTANNMKNGVIPGIILFDEVNPDKEFQGEKGVLNFYFYGSDNIEHVNYGVGKKDSESNNQIVDASSIGTTWEENRNKEKAQDIKAYAGYVNKTFAPFSRSKGGEPDFQAYIDFSKLKVKKCKNYFNGI